MRIVVDTNVLVSGMLGQGSASIILGACIRNEVRPVISGKLLYEYHDVLSRDRIFEKSRLNTVERATVFAAFTRKCELTEIHFLWRPNLQDEADNHIVELAVSAKVDHVVTFNKRDFANSELKFDHFRVTTPQDFLRMAKL